MPCAFVNITYSNLVFIVSTTLCRVGGLRNGANIVDHNYLPCGRRSVGYPPTLLKLFHSVGRDHPRESVYTILPAIFSNTWFLKHPSHFSRNVLRRKPSSQYLFSMSLIEASFVISSFSSGSLSYLVSRKIKMHQGRVARFNKT